MAQFLLAALGWVLLIFPAILVILVGLRLLQDQLTGGFTAKDLLVQWLIFGIYAAFATIVAIVGTGLLVLVVPAMASHWGAILIGALVSVEIIVRIRRQTGNSGHSGVGW